MRLGMYPQWLAEKEEDFRDEKCYKIGMEDVSFINEDESHNHAYVNWKEHKNDIFYFKSSPIEWRILEEEEDRLLVLSEYSIECKQFHEKEEPVTWEQSSLRKWLNGDFFENAFHVRERECILESEIINEWNPITFVQGSDMTKDRIFLLSFRDVMNTKYGFESYIASSDTRESKNTDWAKIMGALTNPEKGMGWWWLRSAGQNHRFAGRVDYSGHIYFTGLHGTLWGGVRPAMYLDKKKLEKLNGL